VNLAESQWETDIISGCAQNNRIAQKTLYERYHGPMLGVCLRYSNHREDAVEILNMGFFKIFKSISKFKQTGSFEGWMRRIMVNECLMALRKKVNFQLQVEVNNLDIDTSVTVDSKLAYEELLKVLETLPVGYRTVFNMYVIEGYKHREIAEKLGISINTSKSQLILAKKRLREIIKKKHNVNVS